MITGACLLTVAKCFLCVYEITEEEQRDRALELQRKEKKEKTKQKNNIKDEQLLSIDIL